MVVAVAVVAEACGDGGASTSTSPSTSPVGMTVPGTTVAPIPAAQTVEAIAAAADAIPELSVMSTALKTAGQAGVETLAGLGPVTVFAPTNDALVEVVQQLNALGKLPLARADAVALSNYSVIDGRHTVADLLKLDGQDVPTRHGSTVKITTSGSTVKLNGIPITQSDIDASGNILHIVEQIILPIEFIGEGTPTTTQQGDGTVADVIASQPDLAVYTDGAKTFGVFSFLMGPPGFMVFAPTNDAFITKAEELDQAGTVPTTGREANSILMGHVAYDIRSIADLIKMDGQSLPTLNGGVVQITVSGADVMIDGAKVVRGDLNGTNGVVHVIDQVLQPAQT